MKKITIELPKDLADDIIKKAALYRKNNQRHTAQQLAVKGRAAEGLDINLPDEDFLIASIKAAILSDYRSVCKAEAMKNAAQALDKEISEKLKGV
jgi:hypothetical protein